MDDPTTSRDRSAAPGDTPEDANALIPRPAEERTPPPVDVDAREGRPAADTIAMPDHAAREPAGGDIDDQIDDTLPAPTGPAPAVETPRDDLDDQIEETLPEPEETAPEPVEADELDPEAAARREGTHSGDAHTGVGDVFTALSMDAPEAEEAAEAEAAPETPDDDAGHDESILFRTAAGTARPQVQLTDTGTTTCPVCGQETDALRFCGHCGSPLTRGREPSTATSPLGRAGEMARGWLEPLGEWTRPAPVRLVLAAGGVLVLLALLANSGGLALMIGAAILPIILVLSFMERDVFESESPLLIAGLGVAGVLAGAVLGWLGAWLVARSWFDAGVLNYGAAGFGGRFAEAAGTAPFVVWLIVGIVLPLVALVAIAGIPVALRQSMALRNEVMDGLTLAGAVAAGVSLGSAMVFAAPMLSQGGPASDASGWTLTTIGLTILRPLIWTLSGAILGVAVWRYMRQPAIGAILLPVIGGVAAPLLHTFVSIQVAPTGLWPEIIWGVVVAVAVAVLYRMTLASAIAEDRQLLGSDQSRVVCPHCHQVTPSGAFCAHCGQPLEAEATA